MNNLKTIDWNKMSELGLIYKINKEVLHPLGLAMSRNPETGLSEFVYISNDFEFEYESHINENNALKLNDFLDDRINVLKTLQGV